MPIARRRPVGQARRDEEEEEDEEESMRGGRHIDKNVRGVMKRRKREKRTHGIKELEWNWSGIGRERERANYWKHVCACVLWLRNGVVIVISDLETCTGQRCLRGIR